MIDLIKQFMEIISLGGMLNELKVQRLSPSHVSHIVRTYLFDGGVYVVLQVLQQIQLQPQFVHGRYCCSRRSEVRF